MAWVGWAIAANLGYFAYLHIRGPPPQRYTWVCLDYKVGDKVILGSKAMCEVEADPQRERELTWEVVDVVYAQDGRDKGRSRSIKITSVSTTETRWVNVNKTLLARINT